MLSLYMRKILSTILFFLFLNSAYAENTIKYGEVKSGQGLYQALVDVSIGNAKALEVINALSDEVEFSKLKVGDKLEATFNEKQELIEFSFSQNPVEKHIIKLNSETQKWDYTFFEERTN